MSELTWINYSTTEAGKTVMSWETIRYAQTARRQFGNSALQLGTSVISTLSACNITHQILVSPVAERLSADDIRSVVIASPEALPFATESIDFITWPHGPDCTVDSRAALAEIFRVLTPNGILATTFFHRNGSWQLRQKLPFVSSCPHQLIPAGTTACSISAIRALLLASGLSPEEGSFGVYGINAKARLIRPSLTPDTKHEHQALLPTSIDLAADRWCPTLGNIVYLTARKKTQSVTLVGRSSFTRLHQVATRPTSATANRQNHS